MASLLGVFWESGGYVVCSYEDSQVKSFLCIDNEWLIDIGHGDQKFTLHRRAIECNLWLLLFHCFTG